MWRCDKQVTGGLRWSAWTRPGAPSLSAWFAPCGNGVSSTQSDTRTQGRGGSATAMPLHGSPLLPPEQFVDRLIRCAQRQGFIQHEDHIFRPRP